MVVVQSSVKSTISWQDIADGWPLQSGDQIQITLRNGEDVTLQVAHDENGKRFFVFRDCLNEQKSMNDRDTNSGGWHDSKMRRYAGYVFDLLPDDLREVIVPTRIVQIIQGTDYICNDKLFCLSATQVFGKGFSYYERYLKNLEPDDTQLDIFKDRHNRMKLVTGEADHWWLRSPNTGYVSYFWYVGTTGYGNSHYADSSLGVCFGFCIREPIEA